MSVPPKLRVFAPFPARDEFVFPLRGGAACFPLAGCGIDRRRPMALRGPSRGISLFPWAREGAGSRQDAPPIRRRVKLRYIRDALRGRASLIPLRCPSSSAQIHFVGFCADPWDTLWGRVFRFPQTAGWGPSDSLHCSISPRRIVLHFCDICRGEFYRSDSFFGSGYASPWVSTRIDLITTGVFGLSFQRLVGTWEMRTASSTPSVT